ncbi:type II toxin-antitoxin system RelE/ParE family toxin [Marinihelvus fidelis]|uniref:Type II toxin-antitoxin system RelE/ParE family toxin n=1 Tax=Marinihelvus fidelis TaxID=2613842 RepID=A0A5N0THS1_9GAMM|nr:type II toxin-antitoxin system RelE/ParE family toxin [Marinihelvus fidelis]KAA9134004.1 type II toxin-antitoxin system RelE/ParE family toxin [Marinihelvus fidelis]
MASYELVFRKSVTRDFRSIPKRDVGRILKRIERLLEDPRPSGCEKLSGQDRYRVRQGVYRIIYEISDRHLVITVVKVGHRQSVYRK